jgi:signal peptidase I
LRDEEHAAIAAADVEAREENTTALPPPQPRFLRSVYVFFWFLALPTVLACAFVWALSPASGVEPHGVLGWLESWVREQPVPVAIIAFTVFEVALWAARAYLPPTRFAHAASRADLPEEMRAPFERARALLDEADAILTKNAKAVERDLSPHEREKLKADLDGLRAAMARERFDEESFVEALVKADGEVDVRLGRWRKSEVREYLESILVAIAVAMALRAFVVEAFKIPSGSMIPTLQVGDHIFVNKFVYGPAIPLTDKRVWTSMPPKRGDVMVFAYPEHPEQDFIKRVIALPGDTLEVKNGHPIINGWPVPHCYVGEYSYTESDVAVPQHHGDLYVEYLGDEAYLTLHDSAANGFPEEQGPFRVLPDGERNADGSVSKLAGVFVMGDNRNNSHDSRLWWGGQGGAVPFVNIRGKALFVWLSVTDSGIDWSRLFAPVMGRPRLPAAMKSLEPALDKCLRDRPPIKDATPPDHPPDPAPLSTGARPAVPGAK